VLQLHNKQLAAGGAEIQVDREAAQLRDRGHDVEQLIVDNHDIEALGSLRAGVRAVWNRDATARMSDAVGSFRPDVVHVHTPFPLMSPAVFRTARRLGVPSVTTVRSFRYSCVRATLERDGKVCEECVGRRLKIPALRHRCYHDSVLGTASVAGSLTLHRAIGTFAMIDRVIVMSEFVRDHMIAEGYEPSRISIKPNSYPDPGASDGVREHQAVFAARLAPEKGVLTLLDAWKHLDGDLRLIVIGDGVLRSAVEAAAARDPRIEFRGWVPHDEAMAVLRASKLAIVPSEWYETFGNVVVEAIATATPVAVSDLTNNTDVIEPGVQGEVFGAGDARDLAKTVRSMIDNPRLADQGLAGRARYLERYTPDIIVTRLLEIYQDAVVAARSRREAS
jgi:glycosyltransferase involved in cell wall biosynthesis